MSNDAVAPESSEISIQDLVAGISRYWLGLSTLFVLSVAGAVVVALVTTPVYRSVAVLTPAAIEGANRSAVSSLTAQLGAAANLLGGANTTEGLQSKDVRIATLTSRRLTEEFINSRNLMPLLFPEQWDAATNDWKVRDGAPWKPTMDAALEVFNEEIRSLTEDRRTGIITLSIDWTDPELAADWANDLVRRANDYLRGRVIEETRRSMTFLEGELERTSVVERKQIIYRLIESRTSEVMLANARQEYAFTVVDPAVASSPDNYVRPQRPYIVAVGGLIGLFLGLAYAIGRWAMHGNGARRGPRLGSPA